MGIAYTVSTAAPGTEQYNNEVNSMVANHERGQVAGEIRDLQTMLDLNSEQVAALLRNHGESYPSGGLIRTYVNQTA